MDNHQPESDNKTKLKEQQIMRKSTLLSFAAAALFLGLSYFFFKDVPSPYQEQLTFLHNKPVTQINLDLFQDKEAKTALDHIPVAGELISFRVSANYPVHAALLASVDAENPLILLEHERIPPGRNLLLKRRNTQYTYQVAQKTEHITFCLLYADDGAQLLKKINQFNIATMMQQQNNCANW